MHRILPVPRRACSRALSTDRVVGDLWGLVAVRLLEPHLGSPAARSVAPWGRIGVSQGHGGLARRLDGGAGACALLVLGWRRTAEAAGLAVLLARPGERCALLVRLPHCVGLGVGGHR